MAVTYGFYDSLNHDRLYNAQQMSAIFDGIINDGVFMSVGNQFHTVAGTGMQVIVKSGRAWFDSTWTLNDAEYPLSIDAADVLLTRIDAVVLEVNSEVATRANTIKVVKGTPASTPAKPTLTNTATIHQHALAYVTVTRKITAITNSMIEIVVGKTETPYVTAILQTTDISDLFNQWEDYFQKWFDTVRGTLDGDVALNLQNQITTLERSILKIDTKTAMGLPSTAVGDDAFNYLLDKQTKMKTAYSAVNGAMLLVVETSSSIKIPRNLSTDFFDIVAIGGGGGAGYTYSNSSQGGGGGGGYTVITRVKKDVFPELFTNRELTIVIGAGGSYKNNANGSPGGNTSVIIPSSNTELILAKGGNGGQPATSSSGGDGGSGGSGGGGGGTTGSEYGGNGGIGYTGGGGGGGGAGEGGYAGSGGVGRYGGGGGGGMYSGTVGTGGSGILGGKGGNGMLGGGVKAENGEDMNIGNTNDISISRIFLNMYRYYITDINAYNSIGGQGGSSSSGYYSGGGGGGGAGFRCKGGAGAYGKNGTVGSSGGGGGGYMSSGCNGYIYGKNHNYDSSYAPTGGGGGNMFTLDGIKPQRPHDEIGSVTSYAGYGSGGRGLGILGLYGSDSPSLTYIEYGGGGNSYGDSSDCDGCHGVVVFIFYIDNKI
jgi:hypothetical protein